MAIYLSAFGPIVLASVCVLLMVLVITVGKSKRMKLMVLFLGPIVTLSLVYLLLLFAANALNPPEGSGVLLGGATFGLLLVAVTVYYPIFLIVSLFRWWKSKRGKNFAEQISREN